MLCAHGLITGSKKVAERLQRFIGIIITCNTFFLRLRRGHELNLENRVNDYGLVMLSEEKRLPDELFSIDNLVYCLFSIIARDSLGAKTSACSLKSPSAPANKFENKLMWTTDASETERQ